MSKPIALALTLTPDGDGATLRWEADVLGVRYSRLAAPVPPADLPLVLRALNAIQDPAYPFPRTAEQATHFAFAEDEVARLGALGLLAADGQIAADAPRRLGRRLYAALTADGSARAALDTTRAHAAALGRPIGLELGLPLGAPHLAALPWELLWDEGPAPLLLASGLVRRLDLPSALPPPRPRTGPLRILAISPAAGIGPELRQVERAARQEALAPLVARGAAVVEEIEPATRAALVRAVEAGGPPDIVHFYGHGRLRGGEGELLLDDPGRAAWLGSGEAAALLAGAGLVALYACEGAGVALGPGEPLLGGVAQALTAAGVPAVLGMQLAVRATAATRAAAAIYGALAAGHSLEAAAALARRALFVEERDSVSWFVPALYLRGRGGPVPYRLRPEALPAASEAGARQTVVAHGGAIRALRIQGRAGSRQTVIVTSGGTISDAVIADR